MSVILNKKQVDVNFGQGTTTVYFDVIDKTGFVILGNCKKTKIASQCTEKDIIDGPIIRLTFDSIAAIDYQIFILRSLKHYMESVTE